VGSGWGRPAFISMHISPQGFHPKGPGWTEPQELMSLFAI